MLLKFKKVIRNLIKDKTNIYLIKRLYCSELFHTNTYAKTLDSQNVVGEPSLPKTKMTGCRKGGGDCIHNLKQTVRKIDCSRCLFYKIVYIS